MKYLLALVGPDYSMEDVDPEAFKGMMEPWQAFNAELEEAGAFVAGEALVESKHATTVRIEGSDDPLVTDGPYAETKEKLGGFYLIQADSQEEAVEWAKKVPLGEGAVEVRAIVDLSEYM